MVLFALSLASAPLTMTSISVEAFRSQLSFSSYPYHRPWQDLDANALVSRNPGALHGGWMPMPDLADPTIQEAISNAPPLPTQNIVIDLKTQTLTAFSDGEKVYGFYCSTGRNGATPRGEFPIRQKLRYNRALPKYGSVPIPFSLRLDIVIKGRRHLIAIHAHNSVPRYPASHGCIRLRHTDAKKLFAWAEVGVPVTIK